MDASTLYRRFRELVGRVVATRRHGPCDDPLVRCYDSEAEFAKRFPSLEERKAVVECLASHAAACSTLPEMIKEMAEEGLDYVQRETLRYEFLEAHDEEIPSPDSADEAEDI